MPAAMTKKDLVAENNKLRDRIKELEQREGDGLPTQSSPTKKKAEEPTEGLIFYADGRVASCSPDTAAILGYTPQELMSFSAKTVANHIHPADRPRVQTNMRLRFEGKSTPDRNQYRCLHKNGHLVWLEVSSHFTTYRGKPALIARATDLTKQRQSLIDSEEFHRRLMENPLEGICLAQDGNYIFMNDTFSRIFGYSNKELMGKPILTIVDPKEHKIISDRVRKRCQHKKIISHYIFSGIKKDKTKITIEITVTGPFNYQDKPTLMAVMRDITDQKEAEKKLQESESLNRRLLQAAPVGIGLVVDRTFQFVNTAMCEMVGYSEKELVGSKALLIYPNQSEYKRVGGIVYPQFVRNRVGTVETQFRRKDGTIIDVMGSASNLDPHAPDKGQLFIIMNITEKKKNETNLDSAKEIYKDLLNMAPDGIITVDLLGRVTTVNQAYIIQTGYRQEELVGKHFTQLPTVLSKDIPRYISLFTGIIKGKDNKSFDFRWKNKNRDLRSGEIRTALIRRKGRILGIQAIIRDHTEKKEQEAAQRIVYQIANEAKTIKSFDNLFKFIHKTIAKIMPAKNNFYIALYDEKNQVLDYPYFQDEFESNPGPQPLGKGLTEYVLFSGESLLATPAKLKQLDKEGKIKLVGPPCINWLGVPLMHENLPVGVMVVQSYEEGIQITETHKNLFKFISDQIGSVIERKRAEEALKKNERQYRGLFEHGNSAITLFDVDGILIVANRKAASLLGYEVDEMQGLSYKKLIHSREELDARSKLNLAKKSKPIPLYERRCLRKDGSEFIGEFAVSPVHDDSGNLLFIQSIFRDITDQKRIEREMLDSRERLRNFAAHLQSAREQERRHIAREIHDELGQFLTALKMDINWMSKHINNGHADLKNKIKDMDDITSHTIQSVKQISTELRPGLIDDLGFTASLEWHVEEYEKRVGIKTSCHLPPDEISLDKDRAIALFRICQEALTNIARHSKASRATINVKRDNGNLHLEIKDNGIGIKRNQKDSSNSFGLIGIQERAQFLGGKARIEGKKDSGTTVDVLIPITHLEVSHD